MALELLSYYRKSAAGLELVPSGEGRFEVSINGKEIFSKLAEDRFPQPAELIELIDQELS